MNVTVFSKHFPAINTMFIDEVQHVVAPPVDDQEG